MELYHLHALSWPLVKSSISGERLAASESHSARAVAADPGLWRSGSGLPLYLTGYRGE